MGRRHSWAQRARRVHGAPDRALGFRLLSLAALAALAGCAPQRIFHCTSKDACRSGDEVGICQPSGYCSFPDADCPSGQRYVEQAPAELAELCVAIAPIDVGLVGHWSFDDGSGTRAADSSGNGRNGTLNAGASWTDGWVDGAVHFDDMGGRVAVKIPGFGKGSFAAFAWVLGADNTGGQSRIMGVGTDGGYTYLDYGLGTPQLSSRDDANGYWDILTSTHSIGDGRWHPVGFVIDREAGKSDLYVDGSLAASAPPGTKNASAGAFGQPSASYDFLIGSQNDAADYSLEGSVDEVRLYRRALTPDEMTMLSAPH